MLALLLVALLGADTTIVTAARPTDSAVVVVRILPRPTTQRDLLEEAVKRAYSDYDLARWATPAAVKLWADRLAAGWPISQLTAALAKTTGARLPRVDTVVVRVVDTLWATWPRPPELPRPPMPETRMPEMHGDTLYQVGGVWSCRGSGCVP